MGQSFLRLSFLKVVAEATITKQFFATTIPLSKGQRDQISAIFLIKVAKIFGNFWLFWKSSPMVTFMGQLLGNFLCQHPVTLLAVVVVATVCVDDFSQKCFSTMFKPIKSNPLSKRFTSGSWSIIHACDGEKSLNSSVTRWIAYLVDIWH